jgi:hypothetical protein
MTLDNVQYLSQHHVPGTKIGLFSDTRFRILRIGGVISGRDPSAARINSAVGEKWKASIRSTPILALYAAASVVQSTWTRLIDSYLYALSKRVELGN